MLENIKKDPDPEYKWEAEEFINSPRGQFIMSQALCLAIKKLEEVKGVMQEKSNIADMKYLQDELFPMYLPIADLVGRWSSNDT